MYRNFQLHVKCKALNSHDTCFNSKTFYMLQRELGHYFLITSSTFYVLHIIPSKTRHILPTTLFSIVKTIDTISNNILRAL